MQIRLIHISSVKQLEREFTTYFLVFPIGEAAENSKVENICTDAIANLNVRIQMRHD